MGKRLSRGRKDLLLLAFGILTGAIPLGSENPLLPGKINHNPTPALNFTTVAAAVINPAGVAIKGYVQNNCNFPIYVQYATCCPPERRMKGDGCVDDLQTLHPRTGYWSSGVAVPDACSQTIRMYKFKDSREVYQLEYNVDVNGIVWYNLSSDDGSPFTSEARFLTVGEGCMYMYCRPGDEPAVCDWPHHLGSCSARDVRFYLC
ncbi:uncharacterized protein EI97DRAFT_454662 [Westerdykella ornata]|uniref:Uncharacterized protein n=1 Tax=Westerdykella ornata TaxID=318751 RepID=A0A6A6JXW9_WESOR|nr:uncharacterized protein EI97DRAFT_454662 [Westerdykella ornata]KAF2281471.1 hypothetical protein EI97DRAFT_454662 [Westerdykella ornata]